MSNNMTTNNGVVSLQSMSSLLNVTLSNTQSYSHEHTHTQKEKKKPPKNNNNKNNVSPSFFMG